MSASRHQVVVAGSINMDVVAQTDKHPQAGETIFGSNLQFIPGGKGSNQAVAASRLYANVHLVGKLGRDAFGDTLHRFLQGESLGLSHLSFAEGVASGTALIVVNAASENTIVVIPGANGQLLAADVAGIDFRAGDVAVSVMEIPQGTIRAFFTQAKRAGASTILNAAPAAPFISGLLAVTDVLVLNETELAYYVGEAMNPQPAALQRQAEQLRAHAQQTLVVTLGKDGALLLTPDALITVPGRAVQAVDTTGAGDCFVGALAVALAEGKSLADAARFANVAAALSVQQFGAAPAMPQRAAVEAALA